MQEYRGRILPASHPYTRFVDGVLKRLVPHTGMQDGDGNGNGGIEWEVHVIKDDGMINAFVLPGLVCSHLCPLQFFLLIPLFEKNTEAKSSSSQVFSQ